MVKYLVEEKMSSEIIEFLKQYPKFNLNDYTIESRVSERYGGDWEIYVWEKSGNIDKYDYIGCWWCKLWNNEAETTYVFEREEDVHVLSMQAFVDFPIYLGNAHYEYDENDPRYYTDIEDAVVEQYKQDNIERVKKLVCEKIMNGEIPITIYSNDSDCWEAPIKQISKIYKV